MNPPVLSIVILPGINEYDFDRPKIEYVPAASVGLGSYECRYVNGTVTVLLLRDIEDLAAIAPAKVPEADVFVEKLKAVPEILTGFPLFVAVP